MSYISSYFHCVFSTKERRPLIPPQLQERLWPYLGGIARQTQPEHHRKLTFQEEFLALLRRHRIACDERYLWE
ncbi:MAG TPA: hypothetical protein PKI20_01700 [Verrucomicrobiota bacterium]|nr:hypothetical protein [Verrucomicrobiota bacterium]HQL78371.1 hypothetical protein [Verrucomicrobiota bacterium]